jgi:NADPH:quinone reductase-like Zn-dependent oxidoreductase
MNATKQTSVPKGKAEIVSTVKLKRQDLVFLRDLVEAGKIAPVMDKCYPLRETAEAMRQFGVEHARRKIIITPVTSSACE